jgi:hypothetical protein
VKVAELDLLPDGTVSALSSNGVDLYRLRLVEGSWRCMCKGFQGYGYCYHSTQAAGRYGTEPAAAHVAYVPVTVFVPMCDGEGRTDAELAAEAERWVRDAMPSHLSGYVTRNPRGRIDVEAGPVEREAARPACPCLLYPSNPDCPVCGGAA